MGKNTQYSKYYISKMTDIMKKINNKWPKEQIEKIIKEMTEERIENPKVILDNSYTQEEKESNLLAVLNWCNSEKPIIAGNGTFYKTHKDSTNPTLNMLRDFKKNRKEYKKKMFSVEEGPTSDLYKYYDRSQLNEKINNNSYYGASGMPVAAFYNKWSGPATTNAARQVISETETMFEALLADNFYFLNITEAMEWIKYELDNCNFEMDSFIIYKDIETVTTRLCNKIIDQTEYDHDIISNYLSSCETYQITYLYYKNNLISFIDEHDEIQALITNIFSSVENLDYSTEKNWFKEIPEKYRKDFIGKEYNDWKKFVDKSYFMDPNDVPETIKNPLQLLTDCVLQYVYSSFSFNDRIYRLQNFKRKCVTVIDTDSNILSLDTIMEYLFKNVITDDYGRDKRNNVYIGVNTLAYIITESVNITLLKYGEYSNVQKETRPVYNMKNEFFFSKLVIGKKKKRYMSRVELREGNLMDPPKYDVKGFEFMKSTTSEYAEEFFMDLVKNKILSDKGTTIVELLGCIKDFKNHIKESLYNGEVDFLPNAAAKVSEAYKNPESQAVVKGVLAWDLLNPDDTIELPNKVKMLKLNIFTEKDIESMKDKFPTEYKLIKEKIFNDTTSVFVKGTYDPGIGYVNPKKSEWYNDIPKKFRAKYKKLGPKAWNDYVDSIDLESPETYSGEWNYKKEGLLALAIPRGSKIPEWAKPYMDTTTIVNNIVSPFIPVLEAYQSKYVYEGKSTNGINRKTKRTSNIIKF